MCPLVLIHLLCQQDDLEAIKCCFAGEKSCPAKMGFGGSIFTPLFLQSYAAHLSFLCKSSACSCYHHRAAAEGSLLGGFKCSGPRYKLYCTKGNILGDSWTCCQAPGPLLSLHPPNGGLECGLGAAVTGTQPLAVRVLQLLKPFFPLCPGKAAPKRYLFAGPFPLQT